MAAEKISEETAAEVIRLYVDEGAKLAEITDKTGVPRSSIYWILQKAGTDPNRQGTRRASDSTGESLRWAMERVEELAAENGRLKQELAEAQAAVIAAVNRR